MGVLLTKKLSIDPFKKKKLQKTLIHSKFEPIY
jgi:hypothetical protein